MTETLKCGAENCLEQITTDFAHLNRMPWYCAAHLPADYLKSPSQLNPRSWWACPRCGSKDLYESMRPAGMGFGTSGHVGEHEQNVGFVRGVEKKVKLCRKCGEIAQQNFRSLTKDEKAQDKQEFKRELPKILFMVLGWVVFISLLVYFW